jgi:hypothetical protein
VTNPRYQRAVLIPCGMSLRLTSLAGWHAPIGGELDERYPGAPPM